MSDRTSLRDSFRTVEEKEANQFEKRMKKHRRRKFLLVLFICVVLIAAVVAYFQYETHRTCTGYEVIEETEREDTRASGFKAFANGFLKYTKDGVSYVGSGGELILSQGYEMDEPAVASRGSYAAIYDKGGTDIYIINKEASLCRIKVTVPIHMVSIAANGSVAVLMEKGDTGYMQLYDKTGEQFAGGELHVQNTGYPLSLALSADGESMAVSILDINEGRLKNLIAFYNFGSAGQNEIDKIVGSFSYSDIVIPELSYTDDGRLLAFADDRVIMFGNGNRPSEEWTIRHETEVRSVAVGKDAFALTYDDLNESSEYITAVYDMKGKKLSEIGIASDYEKLEFLSSGELMVSKMGEFSIFLTGGRKRVELALDSEVYCVVPEKRPGRYTFVTEGRTIKARLK